MHRTTDLISMPRTRTQSRRLRWIRLNASGGALPRTQQRLVEAWAEIHHAALLDDWQRLQSGHAPLKIEPLHQGAEA